jgi:hypothetical protein
MIRDGPVKLVRLCSRFSVVDSHLFNSAYIRVLILHQGIPPQLKRSSHHPVASSLDIHVARRVRSCSQSGSFVQKYVSFSLRLPFSRHLVFTHGLRFPHSRPLLSLPTYHMGSPLPSSTPSCTPIPLSSELVTSRLIDPLP